MEPAHFRVLNNGGGVNANVIRDSQTNLPKEKRKASFINLKGLSLLWRGVAR